MLGFVRRAVWASVVPGLVAATLSCSGNDRPNGLPLGDTPTAGFGSTPDGTEPNCELPNTGCSCSGEGTATDCGHVTEQFGTYITCSMGTRTCTDGVWGACVGERVSVKSVPSATAGPKVQTLGPVAVCPVGFDACDPYCNRAVDTPGGFNAGTGFTNTPAGLTLYGTFAPTCSSLTLTPSTNTVTLSGTSLTSLSSSPVTFTLTASPSGCIANPFPTTWTTDKFDRTTISGTNNQNGSLSVVVPIAGTVKVTAYAAGKSATANITVKLNVLETPTTNTAAQPNKPASAAQIAAFGPVAAPLAGLGSSSAVWLYPYANTYFPLALPAPAIQYRYSLSAGDSTVAASAVKVSLRYPVSTTPTTASFNYSLVVLEGNSVNCTATPAQCNFLDPQITMPQLAWQYFEQTARGQNAELIVQRLRTGANVLEPELRLPIHFISGQLKGTVYYQSYSSPKGGNTGAILSIAPGATTPTLAVQPNGSCSICHSLTQDGSRLITNGGYDSNGSYSQDVSVRYDTTTSAPSPTLLNSYTNNRFTYGGPLLDGKLYMSHSGSADWHAPSGSSNLYAISDPNTIIPIANWPNNMGAVTPRFSADGDKLAFGFWGGSSIPCATGSVSPCTGSPLKLPSVSGGSRLAVMDLTCSSPPCTTASTGWTASNARDLTPGFSEYVAWPSFTPGDSSVAYQRQYRTTRAILSWDPSNIGTIAGALSELWMTKIPSTAATAAVPTRLSALNGVTAGGASYLPQLARTVINDAYPLYTYRVARHDMSQTVTSGSASPDLVLSGMASGGPWDVRIAITNGGALGNAQYKYSTNGGSSYSASVATAASSALGSSGLKVLFPSGTYNANSTYQALVGRVGIAGTPSGGPWDFRVKINGTGALGTATFKYSSDGGSTWSVALPTAASVSLGTTGLVATFASVTYSSTQWAYGAFVVHYHQDGAQFQLAQSDSCSNNTLLPNSYDYRTNYLPSFAPTTVDGESWLLFTSRRMYGNIATENPWDAQPQYFCTSGKTPSKKLWIAAIDDNFSPGTDPSHPAFYLPGQELAAGNSDPSWVSTPCTGTNGACESDDDCCGGTGASPTAQCRVTSTASFPPTRLCQTKSSCAQSGESCVATSDCCTGLTCPSGGGLCLQEPPKLFEQQTLTREYVASCPSGTFPNWRFFEWQATIPSATQIRFYAQTKARATDSYAPASPLLYATATVSSTATQWLRGTTPIDTLLGTASLRSQTYLLMTMVFSPDSSGLVAPTMLGWRQIYDCTPGE